MLCGMYICVAYLLPCTRKALGRGLARNLSQTCGMLRGSTTGRLYADVAGERCQPGADAGVQAARGCAAPHAVPGRRRHRPAEGAPLSLPFLGVRTQSEVWSVDIVGPTAPAYTEKKLWGSLLGEVIMYWEQNWTGAASSACEACAVGTVARECECKV